MDTNQAFFDLSNAVTAAIDDGGLTGDEVKDAVEEGIANSTAAEALPIARRSKKRKDS